VSPRPLLTLLALTAIGAGAASSADTARQTSWAKDPAQAVRLARVEAGLPALDVGGQPRAMDIAQWMALYDVPGLSVAVFDDFELVWTKAYGVAVAGGSDPVTLGTLFQAGSISKPVAAMAAMHFVERGTLALDADINTALRSWKLPENDFTKTEKVTLRRLLSHSAGTTVHGFPGYAVGDPVPNPGNDNAIAMLKKLGVEWKGRR
jgi:CubicO group peptidase (beta-lactamase class C family)